MKINIKIVQSDKEFVASCPELDINSYGSTKDEAVRRLINVLQFYIDSAQEMGLDVERLDKVLIDGKSPLASYNSEIIHQCTDTIN